MKISNLLDAVAAKLGMVRRSARRAVAKAAGSGAQCLAAGIVTGGLLFSGSAEGANLVVDNGFEGPDFAPWSPNYIRYTHPYGGITGPQLTTIGTRSDYGFNDDMTGDPGSFFHGLQQDGARTTTQIISTLVNPDLSAAGIASGNGGFAFSAWLAGFQPQGQTDTPQITLEFLNAAGNVTGTPVVHNRAKTDNQLESLGEELDLSWALYEVKGEIPTDAVSARVFIDPAPDTGANDNDLYADIVILDAITVIPEPSSLALVAVGIAGLSLGFRRRRKS